MEDRFPSTAWTKRSSGHVGWMIATGSQTTSVLGLESRATIVAPNRASEAHDKQLRCCWLMGDRFPSTAWKMRSSWHVGGMIATGLQTTSILGLESRATIVARFSKPSERSALLTGGKLSTKGRGPINSLDDTFVGARWLNDRHRFANYFDPRLGKPSDYSRSVFQTERAKRTINRWDAVGQWKRGPVYSLEDGFVGARWLNDYHRFANYFGPRLGKPSDYSRSVFQTERAKRTINRWDAVG